MRILEELYHGNLQPEEIGYIRGGRYEEYLQTMIEIESQLKDRLTKEDFSVFKSYEKLQEQAADLTAMEMFIRGFRLGALFERDIESTDGEFHSLF